MDAKKFFIDNLNRLQPNALGQFQDPLAYNLNQGLLALAKQLDEIESRQRKIEHELRQVATRIR